MGLDGEKRIPENKSSNESSYIERTHDKVCPVIWQVFEEHKERRLRCLIDARCKIVALTLFHETNERAKRNIYTSIIEAMQQATVQALLTGGTNEVLDKRFTSLPSPKASLKISSTTSWNRKLFQYR